MRLSGQDFKPRAEPIQSGTHTARLVQLVDFGTQEDSYQGEKKVLKKRGEDVEEPTDFFSEDKEVPPLGGVLRRIKEVTIKDIKYRTEYMDELKKAVIGAIVRLARYF